MSQPVTITSDELLSNTDHHFRVFAGPGAGKTYWLVNHIHNVLRNSATLSPVSQIACISYTNTAADHIRAQLGAHAGRVDVSTIHSFLYRRIVKPYLHLFLDTDGQPLVEYASVNRHEEHRPTYGRIKLWLEQIGKSQLRSPKFKKQYKILEDKLRKLVWTYNGPDDGWQLGPRNTDWMGKMVSEACTTENLQAYKKMYWQSGIIDHEDVLYFAHRLLEEFPLLLQLLSARFPYLFIDEFQDTHPTQARFVEELAANGTVVGVIGDAQQSIFGFNGAMPKHFVGFSFEGQRDYRIEKNRRSTDSIINVLNHIRSDGLTQKGYREEQGAPVRVLCGELRSALKEVLQFLPDASEIQVLTRKNNDAAAVRNLTGEDQSNCWQACFDADADRASFLEGLISATELARTQRYAIALDTLVRVVTRRKTLREPLRSDHELTELARRGIAVSLLEFAFTNYADLSASSVLSMYESASDFLAENHRVSLKPVRKNTKFSKCASSMSFATLASAVRPAEESRNVRTIHQAKSNQWPNVVVWFADAQRIAHITDQEEPVAESEEQEERRITYVALSRAEDHLFLIVPTLPDDAESKLVDLGIHVRRIDGL